MMRSWDEGEIYIRTGLRERSSLLFENWRHLPNVRDKSEDSSMSVSLNTEGKTTRKK